MPGFHRDKLLDAGAERQFTYGPVMRGKSFKAKDPGQSILLNYQYNYDTIDNILDKAIEHSDYAYDYDDIYRLIDADNPTLDDEAFAYDPVGNRLTAQGVAGTWNYNANNELNGYDDVAYEYDANGNMTQKTVGGVATKFFYNTEDRLERVEEGDGTLIAAYYYDPFGRRLWKEVSGTRTYFFYADEGLIGEYDASGSEIKTYVYKPGSTWTTDPLFMKEGIFYYFYHNDQLGTPQKMTAFNGAVVWSAKYSSFGGAEVDAASTITNPLRFPGQYEDEETGLHYNWFRYYDLKIGRYLTLDPVKVRGGINLYIYSKGNPVSFYDHNGLKVKCTNKVASVNIGVWFISVEGGTGVLRCKDECDEVKCYEYSFACGGGGIGINELPIITGTGNAEVGGWSGDDASSFSGFSIQASGAFAVGNVGCSSSSSVSLGSDGITGGGVTTGPAVGLAAGGAFTGCWTWGLSEVPCVLPF